MVALLNRVYGWLESAPFEVLVCIFLLHLFDFAFALVIELVNATSELLLIQSFHVLKLHDLVLSDQEAATLIVE